MRPIELVLQQSPQPSFHKNFEFLLEDLTQKKQQGYQVWISFFSEKQKDRLESIFREIGGEDLESFWENDFVSELHEGFVDANPHRKINGVNSCSRPKALRMLS